MTRKRLEPMSMQDVMKWEISELIQVEYELRPTAPDDIRIKIQSSEVPLSPQEFRMKYDICNGWVCKLQCTKMDDGPDYNIWFAARFDGVVTQVIKSWGIDGYHGANMISWINDNLKPGVPVTLVRSKADGSINAYFELKPSVSANYDRYLSLYAVHYINKYGCLEIINKELSDPENPNFEELAKALIAMEKIDTGRKTLRKYAKDAYRMLDWRCRNGDNIIEELKSLQKLIRKDSTVGYRKHPF